MFYNYQTIKLCFKIVVAVKYGIHNNCGSDIGYRYRLEWAPWGVLTDWERVKMLNTWRISLWTLDVKA